MKFRKIILLFIALQFIYSVSNAQIKLLGHITTNGIASYPTHIDILGQGGYMSMPTIADRNAIPTLRRKYGMLVFVQADNVIYKLNDANLANVWVTLLVDAETLTGTTLKSTVTGSSLTSVGTLTNLTVTNLIAGSITGNAATATNLTGLTTSVATLNNLSGVNSGDQTTITGNAATATKLATSKTINGVAFDGSADITVTADAGTLTGSTLKSTVTNSSLTSVGTIASLTTGAITNSGKAIVGASSAASASAVLEASSTTQGFLPPRMTIAQRDAIASPIAGLMIFCTDNFGGEIEVYNGRMWVNMDGRISNSTLSIGDYYQGGIVAYILVPGNPGYDANVQHGLIAATSDQSTGIQWYNGSYTTTGATGTAIGTGLSNTNAIIASQLNTGSYAAKLCIDFRGGGYTDWYLPSQDELYKLYLNRTAIGGFSISTTTSFYWSSTEFAYNIAYFQSFVHGSMLGNGKHGALYVRAIRAF